MKVAGIVAEYNPFHNGHAYHIEEVRKKTGADYVVVVMSGNFVQRGAPAILDKYTRTKMALLGGADLVIELPVVAATASAETFARTGVALLNTLGCVTHLGFGCETDNMELLDRLASLFVEEPEEYKVALSSYLREGLSFPVARAKSATEYFKKNNTIEDILNSPNNILAIEYLKALKQINSKIQPCPILRKGNGYHDVQANEGYASATAIRKRLLEFDIYDTDMRVYNTMVPDELVEDISPEYDRIYSFLQKHIPASVAVTFIESWKHFRPLCENDFSQLLHYKLCLEQGNYFEYADIKEDLANRIVNMQEQFSSFSSFIEDIKTKNMTYTGVSRALLHILLGIKQSDFSALSQTNYAPYIRVMGFRKTASSLLRELKHSTSVVLTQLAKDQLSLPEEAMTLLQLDISSAHIYNVVRKQDDCTHILKNEYRTPLVIV